MKYLSNKSRIYYCVGTEYVVWDNFYATISHAVNKWKQQNYPREKIWDPRNTQEKRSGIHEIPMRKNLGTTNYLREKIWDLRNTHEKKFVTHEIPTKARWHNTIKPTRPTMARDQRNLAHSLRSCKNVIFGKN